MYYQKIVATLLMPAPVTLLFALIVKTYDIKNLVQRTRFTIVMVLNIVTILITRFYHFNLYSYEFFNDEDSYGRLNNMMKCICIGYFVVLSLFNIMFSVIMIIRLNKYATATKEDEIQKAGDAMINSVYTPHGSINNVHLNRFLFEFKDKSITIGGRKIGIRKLPFRRVMSEPDTLKGKKE